MRVCVIGAGAIGGILATHLLHDGVEVSVVDVDDELLACARGPGFEHRCTAEGLPCACKRRPGEYRVHPTRALRDFAAVPPVDTVFFCVKTTAMRRVLDAVAGAWKPGTTAVSFQNGIDPEELLARVAGPDHTLRAVLNFSARVEPRCGYSMNWFHPPNTLGGLTDAGRARAAAVAELLTRSRLQTRVVDDIKRYAFEKTVLNASMCPVCALTELTMSEVMELAPTRELVTTLLREAQAVGHAEGMVFDKTLDDWLGYLAKGGAHRTSMHADLAAGRETEVRFMNGQIVEHGRRAGVPTPVNEAMTRLILGREDVVMRRS